VATKQIKLRQKQVIMHTNITKYPAQHAGEYITRILQQRATEDILLLCSGGSALSILDHIDTNIVTPMLTLGVVDERFTTEESGNNFLQLSRKPLFEAIFERGEGILSSQIMGRETFDQFYERIKKALQGYFENHTQAHVIGIFGIGEDGHTAGIFPKTENEFSKVYRIDQIVVPVEDEKNLYPERISITPKCIEEHIDEVILYAVGENKCNTVLTDMYNKNLHEHQIPALIPAAHPKSILFTDCTNIHV